MPRALPLLVLLLAAPLAGCERPFVDLVTPEVTVESPDLGAVQTAPEVTLRLRATSFRSVERVEVNGTAAEPLGEGRFEARVPLAAGLNRLLVAATDAGGVVGEDTLWAVRLDGEYSPLTWAALPDGVGGHATTLLPDGRLLVTGGTRSATGLAADAAYTLDPATLTTRLHPFRLAAPRAGHTATPLPDGRVLFVGGARRLQPDAVGDLVPTVEAFDPATEAFAEVPVVEEDGTPAEPPLHAGHQTALAPGADGRLRLYVYGGVGNAAFSGPPALGTLSFIRVFRVEAAPLRLVAEGPRQRFRLVSAAFFTQTPLAPSPTAPMLVAGISAAGDGARPPAPFLLTYAPDGLRAEPAGALRQPRRRHAAARLAPGLVLISGGRPDGDLTPFRADEVFAADGDGAPARFFQMPEAFANPRPRWGHTATPLADGRILIVGGFTGGTALAATDVWIPRP